jgi:hypothetical protein
LKEYRDLLLDGVQSAADAIKYEVLGFFTGLEVGVSSDVWLFEIESDVLDILKNLWKTKNMKFFRAHTARAHALKS